MPNQRAGRCICEVSRLSGPDRHLLEDRPAVRRRAVEVLDRPPHLPFPGELEEIGLGQLGDVIIDRAEGSLELDAEVLRGEGSPAVNGQNFED